MSKKVTTPLQLYKHLLRCVQRLPSEAQPHYKHQIRQAYKSHNDEDNEERIQQIIERAVDDADWVLQKYAERK